MYDGHLTYSQVGIQIGMIIGVLIKEKQQEQ
jgi:hypothetical protein